MKHIELVKGISSSVLGFGCAPILGSVDIKSAKKALDFALDNGINHLDVARSYGYGEAEKFVGKVIKGKRQQMVIASKFGIKPNWKASLFQPVKPLLRVLRAQTKKKKTEVSAPIAVARRNIGDYFLERMVPLRAKDMGISLEKSLKELNSDYLDYLFIHEPHHTLSYIDELKAAADKLKTEGKIRAWGLSYMQSQTSLHQYYLNNFDLLQFNNPSGLDEYNNLVITRGAESNVIFSPMRGGLTDMKPNEKLRKLLEDFPKSVIICSMFNVDHLKQNILIAG